MHAQELKRLRTSRRLTQKGLATLLGVHRNTVNKWEMEINPIPDMAVKLLERIFRERPSHE